ncbi:hypothetical protein [Streptomyces sp. NPDC004100]
MREGTAATTRRGRRARPPRTVTERIKDAYKGQGGTSLTGRYLAHEFRAEPGRRMVHVEDHC